MAAKGKNVQKPNAYGSRPAMSSARANLPPISPYRSRQPAGSRELGRPEYERQAFESKRAAVDKRKAYYRNENLRGKKKKRQDPNRIYRREKEKRIRMGRDYFFVMRKFVCFLMFLLFAVCIGLFVVGYMDLFPQYTSLYTEPDYTPIEERLDEDVDGVLVPYKDKSKFFTTFDPIFGIIKKIPLDFLADIGASPKYQEMAVEAEGGNGDMLSSMVLTYYPIALILFIVIALINMFKALLGMFGRRVYRMFGFSAIWMIICAAVVMLAGVALNMPTEQSTIDFAKLLPFLTDGFLQYTKPVPFIASLMAPLAGPNAAGIGLLAMVLLPLILFILSIFARKKVPYSIFD